MCKDIISRLRIFEGMNKDNFSSQSDRYAKYRPTYPNAVFDYLNTIVPQKRDAWDCGTGNGQVARELAKAFERVFATDISQSQIDHALQADNIFYSVQPAERTNFENQQFDLIVVAQAIHWFDFDTFYAEVRRTAKQDALLCLIGYGRITVDHQIDPIIDAFYSEYIGPYWDPERGYIDANYQTLPFPFDEIPAPTFENRLRWSLPQLLGYLSTWSAVKHFIRENGYDPVQEVKNELERHWGKEAEKEVKFPLLFRIGRL